MAATTRYSFRLSALVVLPFRARVAPGSVEASLPDDVEPSRFEIAYPEIVPLGPPGYSIQTYHFTTVNLEFTKPFNGDASKFSEWLAAHGVQVIRDDVLSRLNHFLRVIKASAAAGLPAATLRNVGELDLVFVSLSWEGEPIFARATSTLFGPGEQPIDLPKPEALSKGVSITRARLTKAVDLVHHGYAAEAVLVAFSLLDLQAQEYVARRLPYLSAKEGEDVLNAIEKSRLAFYLGPLMRICVGESPLDDPKLKAALKELNALRNDAVHRSREVAPQEAQAALVTVHLLLTFMDKRDADFDLPAALEFWTSDAE